MCRLEKMYTKKIKRKPLFVGLCEEPLISFSERNSAQQLQYKVQSEMQMLVTKEAMTTPNIKPECCSSRKEIYTFFWKSSLFSISKRSLMNKQQFPVNITIAICLFSQNNLPENYPTPEDTQISFLSQWLWQTSCPFFKPPRAASEWNWTLRNVIVSTLKQCEEGQPGTHKKAKQRHTRRCAVVQTPAGCLASSECLFVLLFRGCIWPQLSSFLGLFHHVHEWMPHKRSTALQKQTWAVITYTTAMDPILCRCRESISCAYCPFYDTIHLYYAHKGRQGGLPPKHRAVRLKFPVTWQSHFHPWRDTPELCTRPQPPACPAYPWRTHCDAQGTCARNCENC